MLTSDTEENTPQAIRCFDSGVQDTGNLFGLMGKVKRVEKRINELFWILLQGLSCFFDVQIEFFMAKQNEQCALDITNQILVSHPDFSPALLMKMKVFMSLRDWEQTEAVAQRCVLLSAYHLIERFRCSSVVFLKCAEFWRETDLIWKLFKWWLSLLRLRMEIWSW